MQHSVTPSFSAIKFEAYPPPGLPYDFNYNYHNNIISSPSPSTFTSGSSTNMAKRALSDSDCEDLFTDTKDSCITPPGSDAGGVNNVSRKKRRGIIEKRRRDRINNSLSELRRLVPTAFEKQGSAKLEKAEILQMTVDHLKMLHSKELRLESRHDALKVLRKVIKSHHLYVGLDVLAYDPQKLMMDYYSHGFKECAAEVARYLVTVEGMDIQDPLRLRLMSHLQCFSAQRDLANKQVSAWSGGLNPLTPNHSYSIPSHHHASSTNSGGLPISTPLQPSAQHPSPLMDASPPTNHQNYLNSSSSSNHTSPAIAHDPLSNNSNQGLPHGGHMGSHQRTLFPLPHPNHHSHHIPREYISSGQHPNGSPMTSTPYGMTNHQNYPVQSGKPYRPWGAELAY